MRAGDVHAVAFPRLTWAATRAESSTPSTRPVTRARRSKRQKHAYLGTLSTVRNAVWNTVSTEPAMGACSTSSSSDSRKMRSAYAVEVSRPKSMVVTYLNRGLTTRMTGAARFWYVCVT